MKPFQKETYHPGQTPTERLRGKLSPVFFLIELLQHREMNLKTMSEAKFNAVLDESAKLVDLNLLRNYIDDAEELLKHHSKGTYGT